MEHAKPPVEAKEVPEGRVWRACLSCRAKKRKCDGNSPCNVCQQRGSSCEYPDVTSDNASATRRLSAMIDAKLQRMDETCHRMEQMTSRLASSMRMMGLSDHNIDAPASAAPRPSLTTSVRSTAHPTAAAMATPEDEAGAGDFEDEPDIDILESAARAVVDHVMALDSQGRRRYIGGASNMDMIEAMSAAQTSNDPTPQTSLDYHVQEHTQVELPWFARNGSWPRLPFLPEADALPLPPKHISDWLLNVYFDRVNEDFPILYKPDFMRKYEALVTAGVTDTDSPFMSVLFAVFACATGLLPREPGTPSTFKGLKYYEYAYLLNIASTGHGFIEQVQCLALLSLCTAEWNTLAQSWKFAGTAVRSAQDLGLHRSRAGHGRWGKEAEIESRVWWCVYSLDRLLSLCLGRPVAIDDCDCDCEMPSEAGAASHDESPAQHEQSDLLEPARGIASSGFPTLIRLCRLGGKIVRTMNPLEIRSLTRDIGKEAAARTIRSKVAVLDREIASWTDRLVNPLQEPEQTPQQWPMTAMMRTICLILHATCIINLCRPMISTISEDSSEQRKNASYRRCIDAARSCINASDGLADSVPPSHYLAFCSHFLMLSGIILLKFFDPADKVALEDLQKCIRLLEKVEVIWSGAERSRIILQEIYKKVVGSEPFNKPTKRGFGEFELDGTDSTLSLFEAFNQADFNNFLDQRLYHY